MAGKGRVMLSALEGPLDVKIPLHLPTFSWTIEYSGSLNDFFGKSDDGKTPWQRRMGPSFRVQFPEFREVVIVKLAARPNVSQRWAEVIFLVVKIPSSEHIVWMTDPSYEDDRRACEARSIRRLPVPDAWGFDLIKQVTSVPWNLGSKRLTLPSSAAEVGFAPNQPERIGVVDTSTPNI
jgi:hypothetical protein